MCGSRICSEQLKEGKNFFCSEFRAQSIIVENTRFGQILIWEENPYLELLIPQQLLNAYDGPAGDFLLCHKELRTHHLPVDSPFLLKAASPLICMAVTHDQ
ncbi:hypothetical protein STEG23_030707, partial [Scotinomys teguina]